MKKLTFKIITFGCRTNQAESRMIGEELIRNRFIKPACRQAGFNELLVSKKPGIVIINTCCVTRKAEKEVRQAIRRVKRENPDCFLVIAGCFVEKMLRSPTIQRRNAVNVKKENFWKTPRIFSLADLLIGNKDKEKIPQLILKHFTINDKRPLAKYSKISDLKSRYKDKYSESRKALVKIQDGCDKFCTYCIVPYVRGRSVSRPVDEIIGEIKSLIEQGIEEVVLTGIDIASYKLDIKNQKSKIKNTYQKLKINKFKNHLVKLIKLILRETKVKKISFGSIPIEVFDEEFIGAYSSSLSPANSPITNHQSHPRPEHSARAHAEGLGSKAFTKRLSTHFHIPIQSGCDATLKRMGRGYKISNVEFLISNLKKKIPNFTFSTDIIVGFPGETGEEFRESLRSLKGLKSLLGKSFTKIHVFRYSSRKGTVAEGLEYKWGRVAEKIKKKRASQMANIIPRSSTS